MLLAVVSDTHVPTRAPALPEQLLDDLAELTPDVILHAGDHVSQQVIDDLERFAPVHSVRGNTDHDLSLPEVLIETFDGVTVAMRHKPGADISLKKFGEEHEADIVVHGHTHVQRHKTLGELTVLNPGSPTQPRSGPGGYAVVHVEKGEATVDLREL